MAFQGILNVLKSLSELPAFFWFVPPILIVAAMAMIGLCRRRALLHSFRSIAARTGLELRARLMTRPELTGTYRGRSLFMTTTSPRRYSFSRWWTLVKVNLQHGEVLHFRIRRQDPIDRLLRLFRFSDNCVEDAVFDRHFLVWSHDPDGMKQLLAANALREELMRADVYIAQTLNGMLYVYYAREVREPSDAEIAMNAATGLADGLDRLAAT